MRWIVAIAVVACSSKKGPDPTIQELEAMRDKMCACTTQQCLDDMWKTVKAWDQAHVTGDRPPERDDARSSIATCSSRVEATLPKKSAADEIREVAQKYEAQQPCLAPIKAAIDRLPATTWSETGQVRPADRTALATAVAVSYNPESHTIAVGSAQDLLVRQLGMESLCGNPDLAAKIATTPALQPAIAAVRTRQCSESDSGTEYIDRDGVRIKVKAALCVGAIAWVELATGKVLAKVAARTGGEGYTPERATRKEVDDLANNLRRAEEAVDKVLMKAVDAW